MESKVVKSRGNSCKVAFLGVTLLDGKDRFLDNITGGLHGIHRPLVVDLKDLTLNILENLRGVP